MDPELLLPPCAGLVVERVQLCDEIVHVTVRRPEAGAICPRCGTWSEAFHSSYERGLADLPIAGRQAVIDLRVRRFRCYQSDCPSKTFVEQAPVLAGRYAHRTHRLRSMLETIGFSLGGRPGSRHCMSWASMSLPFAAGNATGRFLWMPMLTRSWICWKIPQQTRWWAGSVNTQV